MARLLGVWSRRGSVVLLLLLCLSACSLFAPEPPPAQPSSPYAACLKQLTDQKVVFEPVKDFKTQEGCGVANGVKVSSSPIALSRPTLLSCEMATRMVRFELEVMQPLARKYFGKPVERVHHAGSYNCRNIRESRAHLSQHAFGNAIDIMALDIAGGTRVSVARDWNNAGAKSEFLHALAKQSCDIFSVTLTPNRDALHSDHIHVDIGPARLCGY